MRLDFSGSWIYSLWVSKETKSSIVRMKDDSFPSGRFSSIAGFLSVQMGIMLLEIKPQIVR